MRNALGLVQLVQKSPTNQQIPKYEAASEKERGNKGPWIEQERDHTRDCSMVVELEGTFEGRAVFGMKTKMTDDSRRSKLDFADVELINDSMEAIARKLRFSKQC